MPPLDQTISPAEPLTDKSKQSAAKPLVPQIVSDLIDSLQAFIAYRSATMFIIAAFGTFLTGALGLLILAVYANPWGNWGPTGYHRWYNARRAKVQYIDALNRQSLPQVVVLGSSNTMRYCPATIERHLGKTAFNFGVFWGKSEDFLTIASHMVKDLDHRPELLLVGIDTWTFAPREQDNPVFPGIRRRLLNTPQLARHLPTANPVKLCWAKFVDAFSRQQIRESWQVMHDDRLTRTAYPPLTESGYFNCDGTRTYYHDTFRSGAGLYENVFDKVESGQYPITEYLRKAADTGNLKNLDYVMKQYDMDAFWPRRVEYLTELVRLCSQERINVFFIINPVHPVFYEILAEHTPHEQNLENLRRLLKDIEQANPVVLGTFDASQIENFNGDPSGFFDAYHPATRNGDRIIAAVADMIELP